MFLSAYKLAVTYANAIKVAGLSYLNAENCIKAHSLVSKVTEKEKLQGKNNILIAAGCRNIIVSLIPRNRKTRLCNHVK